MFTVLIVLVSLLTPWPLQILFDYGLGNSPLPPILELLAPLRTTNRVPLVIIAVLAGFLLTLLQNTLEVWNSYVQVKLEQSIVVDIRNAQFEHALRLPMSYHDRHQAG